MSCWKEQTTQLQKSVNARVWKRRHTNVQVVYSELKEVGGPDHNVSVHGLKRSPINKDFKTKNSAMLFVKNYIAKNGGYCKK